MFTDIIDLFEEGDLLVPPKSWKLDLKENALQAVRFGWAYVEPHHCVLSYQIDPKAGAELYVGTDNIPVIVVTKTYLSLSFRSQFCLYIWSVTYSALL